MSAADYFGIIAAIYIAQLMPRGWLLAFGILATVLNLLFLYIGK